MNTRPGLWLFNPNQERLDDETFVQGFVARHSDLEMMLSELRAIAKGGDPRHSVLIGARGMGKSTLLRRIAIGVKEDTALRRAFVALSFREEQYNVLSLDGFWRNCGEALAEWCERNGYPERADALDRAVETAAWRDPEISEREFLAYCAKVGRRPLLLLDNLDLILENLSKIECWSLRRVLQTKGGPIVIGGATNLLTQGGDSQAPFYEFFYPHLLERLTEKEVFDCLLALAARHGEAGQRVRTVLAREPERVRTFYELSGGNPRVLILLYLVLQRAETESIFADLEDLLDSVSLIYKTRIEDHKPQQRAVIDAIALNWDPISSRQISEVTGVEITTISSHLNRLKKIAFIEEVASSGARSSYQLSERFMNIWYLMRHGTRRTRKRLRWLTLCLVRLFSPKELRGMADEIRSGGAAKSLHQSYQEAVLAANELVAETAKGEQDVAESRLEPLDAEALAEPTAVQPWSEAMRRGLEAWNGGLFQEALEWFEDVLRALEPEGSSDHDRELAVALVSKGAILGALGRSEEAIAVYDEIATRLAATEMASLEMATAYALVNKGVQLGALGRTEEEIAVYDEVATRFASSDVAGVQEQIARALVNKGVRLGDLGRTEEAIAVYDEVATRFASSDVAGVQEQIARALVYKGATLGDLGRSEEAIAVYDEVATRFASSEVAGVQEQIVRALFNKGIRLGALGRLEEEIAVYDEVAARFASSEVAGVQEAIARALVNKGATLGVLGRSEEEIAVYEEVATRFALSEFTGVQSAVAQSKFQMGRLHLNLHGDAKPAAEALRDALAIEPGRLAGRANLAWALLFQNQTKEPMQLRAELTELDPEGLALLDAGIELVRENFGLAAVHLGEALDHGLEHDSSNFFEDLLWLMRLAVKHDFGERLIEWFEESGNHDKYAPVFAALVAYVRGERFLNDVNPETRGVAKKLFDQLTAPDKAKGKKEEKPKRRRKRKA